MKTKISTLLAAALMILGTNAVKADEGNTTTTPTNTSGDVTLNIKLKMVQEIKVNHNEVNLVYKTRDDYAGGVSSEQTKHLTVFSTGGFIVKAVAKTDKLSNEIPIGDILLTAKQNAGDNLAGLTVAEAKSLTTADGTTVISATEGGVDVDFDITYKAAGNNEYINLYKDGETNVFTTTVNYTIVPQ